MKFSRKWLAVTALFSISNLSHAGVIDMSAWSESSVYNGANWSLSNGGTTLTQSGNANPGFFLSDTSYSSVNVTGTFQVTTGSDDDNIGMVFGYQTQGSNDNDFVLLNWKQAAQSGLNEGLELVQHNNAPSALDLSFSNTGTYQSILGQHIGANTGWDDLVTHTFDISYSATAISVSIDSVQIFSVTGSFGAGQIGFFNHSQSGAVYELNSLTDTSASVNAPLSAALIGVGLLGLRYRRKL